MMDNLVYATESIRTSVTATKRKLSNIRIAIEQLGTELDKIEVKFDRMLVQSEIYKSRVEREAGRQVRKLELELDRMKKQVSSFSPQYLPDIPTSELKIASTVAVLESVLRHMCGGAEDFKLLSYSILFPAVYERIIQEDESLYLEHMPNSSEAVISRGKKYISHIRSLCDTHVTDPEAWDLCHEEVSNWWKNDALPLLYGQRHEEWDADLPLELIEMLVWKEDPAERPLHFSAVFDVFELYKKHKDEVFETSGVRAFDLKMFNFQSSEG